MTPLRQTMTEALELRGVSPKTLKLYVDCVARFARHYGKSSGAPGTRRGVLSFASEMVADESGTGRNRRVRWWSALALLRALASSPAAAAATLRNRAATAEAATEDEVEEIGQRAVLDQDEVEISEIFDLTPGGDASENEDSSASRRLQTFAKAAEDLAGKLDTKLQKAIKLVNGLVTEGFSPILFCRFIDTAEYVAAELSCRR